jgi:hypothetical protein
MPPLDLINALTIASPCPASWNAMHGDERARFCVACEKHVYNIAALTASEVESLIQRTEGQFCARLYRRRDGTVLTADCPVGAKALAATRVRRLLTLAIVGLGFLFTLFLRPGGRRSSCPASAPSGTGVTLNDWNDWALETLGLRPPTPAPRVLAGSPMPAPAPPPMILGKLIAPRAGDVPAPAADIRY